MIAEVGKTEGATKRMATSRTRRVFWFGCLPVILLMAGVAVFVVKTALFRPFFINHFFDRVFIEYALAHPELLSTLRILEPFGITFHNDDLDDASPEFAAALLEKTKDDLATLRRYNRDRLRPSQRLSYDIFEWYLDDAVRGEPFLYHNFPVNQLFGVQNEFPTFMATIHQIRNKHDAEQYLERLKKVERKFDQVLAGLKLRRKMGIVPPQFVVERVLDEMVAFTDLPPQQNILYTAFHDKVDLLSDIPPHERQELLDQCLEAVQNDVYLAYFKLILFASNQLVHASSDDGVWRLPDGDAYYAYALRSNTTTDLSPEEVHELGLAEVERITSEMEHLLKSIGRTGKPVGELMAELGADPQYKYPDTDEGRRQCLIDFQSIIDEIDRGLGDAFDLRPAVGVEVKRIPAFKESTAAGAYYEAPSLDGTRPGVFYANLRDMNEISKWGMYTLAYHEAIPGHHFQLSIQQQVKGPLFRKVLPFTAYTEGWALYAERLAWELGFEEDPLVNLGRLQAELFRAVRLVVDTGIHYKRWRREEAIDYMTTTTGMDEKEVVSEVERYIVLPGQACAYKIGMNKILELREKAKMELGERFSLKEFHNAVLANGAMPLTILEKVIDEYISNRTGRA